jgi:hypothetical protein
MAGQQAQVDADIEGLSRDPEADRLVADMDAAGVPHRQQRKRLKAYFRARQEALDIAQVLAIAAPEAPTADELQQWLSWWKPSYEAARRMTDERKRYLKAGGWWPPLSASQIGTAPAIVLRTSRPALFD